MATPNKVTVEDVKKAATTVADSAKKASVETKKASEKAKESATKTATKAKESATKAKASTTKAVKKAKKEVVETAVLQYNGNEYTMEDITARCKADFKAQSKKTISEINVYVKPQENKAYYVVNSGEGVGSIDL